MSEFTSFPRKKVIVTCNQCKEEYVLRIDPTNRKALGSFKSCICGNEDDLSVIDYEERHIPSPFKVAN